MEKQFNENLYMTRQIKPENILEKLFLADSKLPEWNQNESLFCDEEITMEECEEVLKKLKITKVLKKA